MSQLGDIVAALVADVTAATTGYTVLDKFRVVSSIDREKYPYAMVYNPTVSTERLAYRQLDETTTVAVLLLRKDGEAVAMRTDVEALVTQIEADPTLGSKVDVAHVSEWSIEEQIRDMVVAVLVVESERVR